MRDKFCEPATTWEIKSQTTKPFGSETAPEQLIPVQCSPACNQCVFLTSESAKINPVLQEGYIMD